MKAIEFLKNKGITRATCYTDGKTYYVDELAKLMEEYAALRQPLVSGRSEQLVCICKNRQDQFKRGDIWICGDCEEEIKQTNCH